MVYPASRQHTSIVFLLLIISYKSATHIDVCLIHRLVNNLKPDRFTNFCINLTMLRLVCRNSDLYSIYMIIIDSSPICTNLFIRWNLMNLHSPLHLKHWKTWVYTPGSPESDFDHSIHTQINLDCWSSSLTLKYFFIGFVAAICYPISSNPPAVFISSHVNYLLTWRNFVVGVLNCTWYPTNTHLLLLMHPTRTQPQSPQRRRWSSLWPRLCCYITLTSIRVAWALLQRLSHIKGQLWPPWSPTFNHEEHVPPPCMICCMLSDVIIIESSTAPP